MDEKEVQPTLQTQSNLTPPPPNPPVATAAGEEDPNHGWVTKTFNTDKVIWFDVDGWVREDMGP